MWICCYIIHPHRNTFTCGIFYVYIFLWQSLCLHAPTTRTMDLNFECILVVPHSLQIKKVSVNHGSTPPRLAVRGVRRFMPFVYLFWNISSVRGSGIISLFFSIQQFYEIANYLHVFRVVRGKCIFMSHHLWGWCRQRQPKNGFWGFGAVDFALYSESHFLNGKWFSFSDILYNGHMYVFPLSIILWFDRRGHDMEISSRTKSRALKEMWRPCSGIRR